MSFLKVTRPARVTLVALAIVVASSQIARAETIFLKCSEGIYTVNLTKSTVDNHPATINETSFDWVVNWPPDQGTNSTSQFHIDRTAGTLDVVITTCFRNGICRQLPRVPPSTCTKASAPSTKF